MFGISYGELFLLVGATAALVGTLSLSLFCILDSNGFTWNFYISELWGSLALWKCCLEAKNWNGFLIIGTKDLPVIARTAGRLAGRAIGYVQLARGQFDNVMHKSQASQVLKFFSLLLLFIY